MAAGNATTYASKKFPWASTGAVHSFDEFAPLEAYEGLMKEAPRGFRPSIDHK
jgi:hypothetical protein